jgi:hypothetical protein
MAAIKTPSREAKATYEGLSAQNRFALAFRTAQSEDRSWPEKEDRGLRRDAEAGETIYPQGKKITAMSDRAGRAASRPKG